MGLAVMFAVGWTVEGDTYGAANLSWRNAWLWIFPLADPQASDLGADWALPLWYIRTYLWFLLISPALLWLFRRWPLRTMVVPGSGLVKIQAEAEGLDKIFRDAGFEWRDPGCSMCLAMNADRLEPGERCASTSNRNFEGRQGAGGRTHLVSPAMAAAAGIFGHFVDVRRLS